MLHYFMCESGPLTLRAVPVPAKPYPPKRPSLPFSLERSAMKSNKEDLVFRQGD